MPPEFELAAMEFPESLVLPVLEPTVIQVSRAAPGLSRNLGSGTGIEFEATEAGDEVGGSIVTGLATIGTAITVVPITVMGATCVV